MSANKICNSANAADADADQSTLSCYPDAYKEDVGISYKMVSHDFKFLKSLAPQCGTAFAFFVANYLCILKQAGGNNNRKCKQGGIGYEG
jgi:hypothetical protein